MPVVHSVYFYETDWALTHRVSAIIESALDVGNSVVVIVTPEHHELLNRELHRRRINFLRAESSGRLLVLDPFSLFESFLVDGRPDRARFFTAATNLIAQAKACAAGEHAGLSIFGEAVSVLWQQGNSQGALELEALWNELLGQHSIYLHCAYPRRICNTGGHHLLTSICSQHSHVLGLGESVA